MLTREEVIKVAQLSRIELGESEIEKFQKELSTVLDYVAELKKVDTEGLEEVSQVTGLVNVQREDIAEVAENREEIFKNAPAMRQGFYEVKAIL
jgi:aspartyl-tRNA(Asn)/glutamyl-tRNA(Gln) amidotransferase subunit C